MDSKKRNRALEIEQKAQKKFNQRFFDESKSEKPKRMLFVFFEKYFGRFGRFFGLNFLLAIGYAPTLLCGFMMYLALNDADYSEFAGLIPGLWIACVVSGLLIACVNTGAIYIMRNTVQDSHIYFFSDFFREFAKNFKQSFFFGILDSLLIATVFVAWPFLSTLAGAISQQGLNFLTAVLLILVSVLGFSYASMRVYTYLQIVTIDLRVPQIIRNSFGFLFLGIKYNIIFVLLGVALTALGLYLITLTIWAALFWLIMGFSLIGFIQVFCAYTPFYKYLIKPEEERMESDETLDEAGKNLNEDDGAGE